MNKLMLVGVYEKQGETRVLVGSKLIPVTKKLANQYANSIRPTFERKVNGKVKLVPYPLGEYCENCGRVFKMACGQYQCPIDPKTDEKDCENCPKVQKMYNVFYTCKECYDELTEEKKTNKQKHAPNLNDLIHTKLKQKAPK